MVTLLVGKTENPFYVHMEMICNESPFFRSAFMGAGHFEETAQKSMKLPEDDPETIDRVVQWIYFKIYPFERKTARKRDSKAHSALMQLARLYVAADKYGIIALKNDVISQLFNIAGLRKTNPEDDMVQYVYSNTTTGSKLRRLMVDWHIWFLNINWFKSDVDGSFVRENSDFSADLIAGMAARIAGRTCPWPDASGRFLENMGSEESDEDSDNEGQKGTSNTSNSGDESSSTA